MSSPRMRPEFTRPLPGTGDNFFAALERALQQPGARCRGALFGTGDDRAAILRRHDEDQHFWSPALHLHLVGEDGRAVSPHDVVAGTPGPSGRAVQLHGRFSPSSPVWTGFLAAYLALACLGIGAACYGGAQLISGQPAWAFLGVPVALALAGFTYGAAFIGQGLGSEDMYELRAFVDEVASPGDPVGDAAAGADRARAGA